MFVSSPFFVNYSGKAKIRHCAEKRSSKCDLADTFNVSPLLKSVFVSNSVSLKTIRQFNVYLIFDRLNMHEKCIT